MESTLLVLVASVLMLLAGLRKRRFAPRDAECPVCHNARALCTCRWL
jgi:hypothetical protein